MPDQHGTKNQQTLQTDNNRCIPIMMMMMMMMMMMKNDYKLTITGTHYNGDYNGVTSLKLTMMMIYDNDNGKAHTSTHTTIKIFLFLFSDVNHKS